MGYVTDYEITWSTPDHKPLPEELLSAITRSLDEGLHLSIRPEQIDKHWALTSEMWWEDPDDAEMLALSRAFPGVLFTLHGRGEEETDRWNTYYLYGKMQFAPAEIYYPPFDPDLLLPTTAEAPDPREQR